MITSCVSWAGPRHHASGCEGAQETIWRQLPPLAQALGKREFKRYLELFIDPLFRCAATISL